MNQPKPLILSLSTPVISDRVKALSKTTITILANDSYPAPDDIISTTDGQATTYQESVRKMVEMQRQALAKKNQPKDPYASITPRRSYGKKNQRFPKGYV